MMLTDIRNYLDEVRSHLHLDAATEKQVIGELYTYFQDKVDELRQKGISEKDTIRVATESFGRARVVARLMYEAYSKGSWSDAMISSIPHLIIAGLFISHLWKHLLLAPIAFIFMVCVTLLGWWHGKPNWLYGWVGYSLVPLLIAGYLSRLTIEQAVSFLIWRNGPLPGILPLLLTCTLLVFSLWIIIRTTIRVVKRDWVLASMMLVPLPIMGSWLFRIEQAGGLFQGPAAALHQWDASMASAFMVLGITSVIFIRLRQRVLKVGAVIAVGSIALVMLSNNLWGGLGFFGLLGLLVFMIAFLFTPALIEAKVGHGEQRGDAWWNTYLPEHSTTTE